MSRGQRIFWLLTAALGLLVFVALGIGTTTVDLGAALHPDPVVTSIRAPRVLLAALVGAALATSGVALQALLHNPLADPYVIGVSGGAALGGVGAMVLGVATPLAVPLFAFLGAVLSAGVLFGLAHGRGRSDPLSLLLLGVVFNAFASAVVTFLKTVVTATKAQEILFWLMGNIGVEPATTLLALAAYVAVGVAALCVAAGPLDLLSMGDETAAALGLPVTRARMLVFLATALLVGAVVAVAGMVGFVGLVVPHLLRPLLGASHRWLLPGAAVGGAGFMVLADALARLTFFWLDTEIPVGVVTAFAGGPFFLALLLRRGTLR